MHEQVVAALACPHDGDGLHVDDRTLSCPAGHRFDLARQGYVNLLGGRDPGTGDDVAMVAAREQVLGSGRFDRLTEAVVTALGDHLRGHGDPDVVVDIGAGTGHHLAAAVAADDRRVGLALDLSKPAIKRAARSHPRVGAAVADVWHGLPVRTDAAAAVLTLFAPRNGPEIARVLRPDGVLVVATPGAGHLAELVGPLDLVTVDPRKQERLAASLHGSLAPVGEVVHVADRWQLDRDAARAVIAMGPSAQHLSTHELARAVATLPDPVEVTCLVEVRTYTPRP